MNTYLSSLSAGVIFDGRNLYDPSIVERFGFTYYAIGRGQQPLASSQAK